MNLPEFRVVSGVLPFLERNKRHIWLGALILIGWVIGLFFANQIEGYIWSVMPPSPAPKVEKQEVAKLDVPPFEQYRVVIDRNFFGVDVDRAAPPPEAVSAPAPSTKPAKKEEIKISPLPAEVVGTMGGSDAVAVALIRDKRNKQVDLYWVGDSLFDQATILKINRAEVLILRNGKTEALQLYDDGKLVKGDDDKGRKGKRGRRDRGRSDKDNEEKDSGLIKDVKPTGGPVKLSVEEVGPNQYVVDKDEFNQVMSDLGPLLTQARVVPNFSEGQINGYKVFAIKPGSVFQQIGLKNGDIIHAVNGVAVDTPERALQLFQQLRAETDFDLDIERGGEEQAFNYQLR